MIIKISKIKTFLLIALLSSFISGCAETIIGTTVGTQEAMREIDRQNLYYCGPDGMANLEKDRPIIGPNLDKLCGRSEIDFIKANDLQFDPTNVEKIIIFKKVVHLKQEGKNVKKNDSPSRPYTVIGTLKFPMRWYHDSTIDELLKEKLSEVGAHAILEYDMYQDSAMLRKSEITGDMLNVYRMRMDANVIRYKD